MSVYTGRRRAWWASNEFSYSTEWDTSHAGFSDGGAADSGGTTVVDSTRAHNGGKSLKMTTTAPGGGDVATRNFRWADSDGMTLPDDCVYEAWFYFDQVYTPTNYWNIMQWKTRTAYGLSDPDWSVNVVTTGGAMRLAMFDYHRFTQLGSSGAGSLTTGTWHKITARYRFHPTAGELQVYLNDALWYSETGVQTQGSSPYLNYARQNQWSVNNYTDGMSPSTSSIWCDDASIWVPGSATALPFTNVLDTFNEDASQALTSRGGWASTPIFGGETSLITDAAPTYATTQSSFSSNMWNQSLPADQEAWLEIGSAATDTYLYTRWTYGAGSNGYELECLAAGGWNLRKTVASSGTVIASGTQALSAGDRLALRSLGTTHTGWHWPSGGAPRQVLSASDAAVNAAGYIGMDIKTGGRINTFGGGAVYAPRALAFAPTRYSRRA